MDAGIKTEQTRLPRTIRVATDWLRENLFSSWFNTLLSVLMIYLLYSLLAPLTRWAVLDADWVGASRDACDGGGACWVYVRENLIKFIYGFYPATERWRINTTFLLLVGLLIPLFVERFRRKALLGGFVLFGYPVIAFWLLHGGFLGLDAVTTDQWGGLSLTLIIATCGMVGAFPFGILLALGRRSEMPIVSAFCTAFIELWRGVPLISVLFMASVMLPLFLPEGVNFDKLVRAIVGVIIFQYAYIAEAVRGGLQAIPQGQYEGAKSVGLSYWQMIGLIILPQALKIAIPGIVGIFISLFKDTSLVAIIGLFDLLGIVESSFADTDWLGFSIEGHLFAAAVYWVFCFSMSRYSQHLERKLDTGYE